MDAAAWPDARPRYGLGSPDDDVLGSLDVTPPVRRHVPRIIRRDRDLDAVRDPGRDRDLDAVRDPGPAAQAGSLFRVVNPSGVYIRSGVEITTAKTGHLAPGETFEVLEVSVNSTGVTRLRTPLGWTSEVGAQGRRYVERVAVPRRPRIRREPQARPITIRRAPHDDLGLDGEAPRQRLRRDDDLGLDMGLDRRYGRPSHDGDELPPRHDDKRPRKPPHLRVRTGIRRERDLDRDPWDTASLDARDRDPMDSAAWESARESALRDHEAEVLDVISKWHPCDLCDKKFKLACNLKSHRANTHNFGVRYPCDLCDKKFKIAFNLKAHQANAHNFGVRWHQCDRCIKRFKAAGHLKTHRALVHDIDVEWYPCVWCGKKFKHLGNLRRHRADVHGVGIQWHSCDQCGKQFTRASNLKRHRQDCHDSPRIEHPQRKAW